MKLEEEIDAILKKKGALRTATEDWKSKWIPAIIIMAYVQTLKSKTAKTTLKALETKYTGM